LLNNVHLAQLTIFHNFLPVNSVKNLLLSGMHTTLVMLLHYLVKHKYQKKLAIFTNGQEGIMVIFNVFK